jgi:hypothetical protein
MTWHVLPNAQSNSVGNTRWAYSIDTMADSDIPSSLCIMFGYFSTAASLIINPKRECAGFFLGGKGNNSLPLIFDKNPLGEITHENKVL